MAPYPSGLREESAKLRFIGSNPIGASKRYWFVWLRQISRSETKLLYGSSILPQASMLGWRNGIRTALKMLRRKACGFESRPEHQYQTFRFLPDRFGRAKRGKGWENTARPPRRA